MRSDLVMTFLRHVASIRSAIASGTSIVMRRLCRSGRGGVISFMSHFYTILWRFPNRNTIYFLFPHEDIDFEIGHLTRQRRAMSEQKLLQLPGVKPVLSNAERERLQKAARLRERVAKSAAPERSARLLADFEQQLASIYRFDSNEIWNKAVAAADSACETAQKAVDEECERLGVPKGFLAAARRRAVVWPG